MRPALIAGISLAASLSQFPAQEKLPDGPDDAFRQIEVLARAMEMIRQDYVDPEKIQYEKLIGAALDGMLKNLDPHSGFIPRSAFEEMRKGQDGTYEGVGITVALNEGALRIVAVREDGPAAAAGILPGDEIVKIGEKNTSRLPLDDAVKLLKGKPGQPLHLTVRRPATGAFMEFDLVRTVLQHSSVKDAMILPEHFSEGRKLGYVRLLQFDQRTPGDLSQALDELEAAGMGALILDLRNNPGGLVSSAVAVCGEFVPPGTTVLTIEGRRPSQNPPPYRTPARGKNAREYPVAILVNHSSASGAEVVAGALQDLKRAAIIGETTFGKGSVQSVVEIPGGGAMRLTTAKYYTPGHRVIHGHGIEPNIVTTLSPEQEKAVAEWRALEASPGERASTLAALDDHQLERAAEALKGVLVYKDKIEARPLGKEPE